MPKNDIPEDFTILFKKKAFAHLGTLMADGSLQITPVWIDYDGQYVLVNSAKGRVKDRNMEARPQVGISIQDPENPYRFISIRGRVVEIVEEGAREHIDALSKRYTGSDKYQGPPDEIRRIYKIIPEHVVARG